MVNVDSIQSNQEEHVAATPNSSKRGKLTFIEQA
jgi:hypothetical protein